MNTNDPLQEREWLLQERARADEESAVDAASGSARRLRYRLVARHLRDAPDASLPTNFAHATALAIEARMLREHRDEARFRRALFGAFVLVYGACMAVAVFAYARDAFTGLMSTLSNASGGMWLVAFIACIGAAKLFDTLRRVGRSARRH